MIIECFSCSHLLCLGLLSALSIWLLINQVWHLTVFLRMCVRVECCVLTPCTAPVLSWPQAMFVSSSVKCSCSCLSVLLIFEGGWENMSFVVISSIMTNYHLK